MNSNLERKLQELIEESRQTGAAAAYAVLNLLYSTYQEGSQNKFASHCCLYSPLTIGSARATVAEMGDDATTESAAGKYFH
ncbi:MAG: hypothetical protein ACKVX9_20070 [Blastocatellia bacterium]